MSKESVARRTVTAGRDPIEFHGVMLAISKARAMASVLDQLGETSGIGNNLVHAIEDGSHPPETREWLQGVVAEALRAALADAEAAFRKSIKPEEALRQIIGVAR